MRIKLLSGWTDEYSYDESIKILKDLAWSHIKDSGPMAEALGNYLRLNDWNGLCDYNIDYSMQCSADQFSSARQALGLFSKLSVLKTGRDLSVLAWDRFLSDEELCRETNSIMKLCRTGGFCPLPGVNEVLYLARRKIARLLGDLPGLSDLSFSFGPGATTGVLAKGVPQV